MNSNRETEETPLFLGFLPLFLFFLTSFIFISTGARSDFHLSYLDGQAEVRGSEEIEWQTLKSGETVPDTAELRTSKNSYLQLTNEDSHEIRINENTGLSLQPENMDDSLELHFGSINLSIDTSQLRKRGGEFTVQTPNAILGVRGTTFQVSYELDDESWFGVDTGNVVVKADNTQELEAGEGADVTLDTGTKSSSISSVGKPRKELETTWSHWHLRQKISKNKERLQKIEKEIKELRQDTDKIDTGMGLKLIKKAIMLRTNKKEAIENQLEQQQVLYEQFRQQYVQFRNKLEAQREDFLERRQKAFSDFEDQNRKQFEEFRKRRGLDR